MSHVYRILLRNARTSLQRHCVDELILCSGCMCYLVRLLVIIAYASSPVWRGAAAEGQLDTGFRFPKYIACELYMKFVD